MASGSLAELLDAFLGWCQKHREKGTYEWHRQRLAEFDAIYSEITVAE